MTYSVVVGANSGIGAEAARLERERDEGVVTWDVQPGADVCCDIADGVAIQAAVDRILAAKGAPKRLTITAGIGHSGMLADAALEDWDRVFAINTRGVWLTMRAFANPMRAAGGGSIVVTSSISASLADQNMGLYCASKAALNMLVRVAAQEWAPDLRVNAVAPGVTNTPMLGRAPVDGPWLSHVALRTPLEGLGDPKEIASAILAVHELIWVTGQILACDGGLSLRSPIDPLGSS